MINGDRKKDQCRCGHERHWHTQKGEGDCVKQLPGARFCHCKRFKLATRKASTTDEQQASRDLAADAMGELE